MDSQSQFGGATQYEFVSGFSGDAGASWEISSQPDEDRDDEDVLEDGAGEAGGDELPAPGEYVAVDDGAGSVVSGLTGAQFR